MFPATAGFKAKQGTSSGVSAREELAHDLDLQSAETERITEEESLLIEMIRMIDNDKNEHSYRKRG